jgi:hypothetical protein
VVTVPEVAVCGVLVTLAFVAGYLAGRRRPPKHGRQTWPPRRQR